MVVLRSWIPVAATSEFSLQNLPFGVFSLLRSRRHNGSRCATRLGDTVIDLSLLEEAGLLHDVVTPNTFHGETTLNKFLQHAKPVWSAVRQRLIQLLTAPDDTAATVDARLRDNEPLRQAALHDIGNVEMHLPFQIAEYTDFYSSREHATNVGIMFRGKDNALQPNWLHLPVGYHGRASTVHVSGHSFRRPFGQLQADAADVSKGSVHAPCRQLDFELEVGTVVGGPTNAEGRPMTLDEAKERIFGFVLLNDWSARDIQKYEYVPLGPFTSKNFATTISPWIVTTEALEPFRSATSAGAQTDPIPLDYLQDPDYSSYDVELTVSIQSSEAAASESQLQQHIVSRSNFKNLYWNAAQQLVHHSVTGCSMRAGDLLGSGTISGSTLESYGSLLELSWKGTKDVPIDSHGLETRKFLQDGDTVTMAGATTTGNTGRRVGFGECTATVLPPMENSAEGPSQLTKHTAVQDQYTSFVLYGYWRSSATWRVRIALKAKGIPYTTVPVDLRNKENRKAEYLENKNPLGQVPVMECFDEAAQTKVQLSQSSAILDFLEEAFPDRPRLFPCDPVAKATARQLLEVVNSGTQPLQNMSVLGRFETLSKGEIKLMDEGKRINELGLAALEVLVQKHRAHALGPFCLGSFTPTVVDIFMVPQLGNARKFGLNLADVCPTLLDIDENWCASHPWFVGARPEDQPDAPKDGIWL